TIGETASWFSHAGGIKTIAAAGRHTIQAHTAAMAVHADKAVSITSSNNEIRILARGQIVLKAGQSSVTLSGGDITFACPGKFSVKGGGNAFQGPGRGGASIKDLPEGLASDLPNWLDLELRGWEGASIKNAPYTVTFADGSTRRGALDAVGYAHLESVPTGGSHRVDYENPPTTLDPPPYTLNDLDAAIRAFIGA
ncbi:MAG: DUF2345 domain-containing protein, partial [Denitromonas halophila]